MRAEINSANGSVYVCAVCLWNKFIATYIQQLYDFLGKTDGHRDLKSETNNKKKNNQCLIQYMSAVKVFLHVKKLQKKKIFTTLITLLLYECNVYLIECNGK